MKTIASGRPGPWVALPVVMALLGGACVGQEGAADLGYDPVDTPRRQLALPWSTEPAPGTQFDGRTGLPLRLVSTRDGAELALVPAGAFDWEPPEYISAQPGTHFPVYVDVYPVLNSQMARYLGATAQTAEEANAVLPGDGWRIQTPPEGQEDHPAPFPGFCAPGTKGYLEWCGRRPLAYMEWQKAARGPHGYQWPWGNEFEEGHAHLPERPPPGTWGPSRSVKYFPRDLSPYGLYGMAGNLWEFVEDPKCIITGDWLGHRAQPVGGRRPGAPAVAEFLEGGGNLSLRTCIGGPGMLAALDPEQPWLARVEAAVRWYCGHEASVVPEESPKWPGRPWTPVTSALSIPLEALRSPDASPEARGKAVAVLAAAATLPFLPELEALVPTLSEEHQAKLRPVVDGLREKQIARRRKAREQGLATPENEVSPEQLEQWAADAGATVSQRVASLRALARESPDRLARLAAGPRPAEAADGHVRLVALGLLEDVDDPHKQLGRNGATETLGQVEAAAREIIRWLAVAATPEAVTGAAWALRTVAGDQAVPTLERELATLYTQVGGHGQFGVPAAMLVAVQQWTRAMYALDAAHTRGVLRDHLGDEQALQGAVAAAAALRDDDLIPDLVAVVETQGLTPTWEHGLAVHALVAMATPEAIAALTRLAKEYQDHPSGYMGDGLATPIVGLLAVRAGVRRTMVAYPNWRDPLPPPSPEVKAAVAAALDELASALKSERMRSEAQALRRRIAGPPAPEE